MVILSASITLTKIGDFGIAQGQVNNITSSLTPEQKAAICDPSDKYVNTTESRICGIPKTINTNVTSNATTSSENTTTTNLAPSAAPPASEGE
jgi:hypothetical protein